MLSQQKCSNRGLLAEFYVVWRYFCWEKVTWVSWWASLGLAVEQAEWGASDTSLSEERKGKSTPLTVEYTSRIPWESALYKDIFKLSFVRKASGNHALVCSGEKKHWVWHKLWYRAPQPGFYVSHPAAASMEDASSDFAKTSWHKNALVNKYGSCTAMIHLPWLLQKCSQFISGLKWALTPAGAGRVLRNCFVPL